MKDNFDQQNSIDPVPGEKDSHGTNVAGVIAAQRNTSGTVGIAYEAKISGYKNGNAVIIATLNKQVDLDVSNNSWGFDTPFTPLKDEVTAIETAVKNGRGKLGTLFVWAGGNERESVNNFDPQLPTKDQRGHNVNSSNYENSRYVIAVAAIDNQGKFASYSNPGAPLLVSAFGDNGSIATIDNIGNAGSNTDKTAGKNNFSDSDDHNGFNGTSSATPMVSGVVALILQANPKLGYRDVQEILAYSARKNDPDRSWQNFTLEGVNGAVKYNADTWTFNGAKNWNGGGLHVNHDYGFGLVDATAAVRLAKTWQLRSGTAKNEAATTANEKFQLANLTLPTSVDIPDNNPAGINQTFKITQGINIDKLELDLNIEHGQFQDLVVKLTSPDKTESK